MPTYVDQPVHVDLFGGHDQFGQNPLILTGTEVNLQNQIVGEAGVPAQFITGGDSSATISLVDGAYQSSNFVSGVSGWRLLPDTLEAETGHFRGDITGASGIFSGELRAASGIIGGFTITAQELYGGIIKTNVSAGQVGSDGVVMDAQGLRGYSHDLGQVFNIPTSGAEPTFSNGVILVSNMQSSNIAGGTIVGAVITGGLLRTAAEGRRIEINSSGIQAINGALGVTLGDNSKKYGDSTRFYGSGVLIYINNDTKGVPIYINQEQTVADMHLYNRSANPSGKAEVGDLAIVNGTTKICTGAGTPGTWSIVGGTPVGVIQPFAGSSAPTGYLLCDGATVSKTTYADLFAVTGHTYGADPGGGSFILPNLKGKVIVGYNSAETEFDALGEAGGAKVHTLTGAESGIAGHNHTQNAHNHSTNTNLLVGSQDSSGLNAGVTAGLSYGKVGQLSDSSPGGLYTSSETATNQSVAAANAANAHQNLQPYLTLNYIIKT